MNASRSGPIKSKLVLLDGNGITGSGDEAVQSKDELMSDPKTLKAFIDYGVASFPAEKYNLVLWDHGEGPAYCYAIDEHADRQEDGRPLMMTFPQIVEALSDNAVTNNDADGDSVRDKFDFIDFDACLMGSVELTLAISEYADRYIASAEVEPGFGQDYRGWVNALGADPDCDSFELGKMIVDDYIYYYSEDTTNLGYGGQGTLAAIDVAKLMQSDFPDALQHMAYSQALQSS